MKIAMILGKAMRCNTFSEEALEKLRSFGEVTINETDLTSPEQVGKVIAGADAAVTSWGSQPLAREVLDAAPNLKLVLHAAGSVKPIVTEELWARGVRVTGSPKPLGEGVAETALGLTITSMKNVFALSRSIEAGDWRETGIPDIRELCDVTIGVVGAGWAGGHYIELLRGFHVNVLLYDPYLPETRVKELGVTRADLPLLLRESDLISLHAPSIPETEHMINAETLGWMKKDAILINTARGSLIDEAALYRHMAAGGLRYACLDVTDPEPPAAENPLRKLPNVIFTPHLAGLVNNGQHKIGFHVCEEIERYLSGREMACEVTREKLHTMA